VKPVLISLYDESGNMVRPWAEAGFHCYCVDILNDDRTEQVGEGFITFIKANMYDTKTIRDAINTGAVIIFAFPPCTDLAVSGARHFEAKKAKNPLYREEAMALVYAARDIAETCQVPYSIENPVSVISTEWRKPNYTFHPCDFGGYLPEDDIHPRWPDYIEPRDAYEKNTCLWTGGGFIMPPKRSVEPVRLTYIAKDGSTITGSKQFGKLGGKSAKTKQIRSETPRGFAKAVFAANYAAAMARWDLMRQAA
jgi:hypothetical protein